MIDRIKIGTRTSQLALWQTEYVKTLLRKSFPDIKIDVINVKTKGDKILDIALDKIEGKGLFTKELEDRLLDGSIDIAVHSLKDLQTDLPKSLRLAAITKRHSPEDVVVGRRAGITINDLPKGATVATGALRRQGQVLHRRPDLNIVGLRGNVNTRINKFLASDWDAALMARAGLERVKLNKHISSVIPPAQMLPAVGQGALGIEISAEANDMHELLLSINHRETWLATTAERSLLRALGGGCKTPIAGMAIADENSNIHLDGLVCSLDGSKYYRASATAADPEKLGQELADELLGMGAAELIAQDYK